LPLAHTYRMVSGDSHLQIPADFRTDRVSKKYRHPTPKRVKPPAGGEVIVSAEGARYFGGTGSYAGHTPQDFDPMVGIDYATASGSGSHERRVGEQDQGSDFRHVVTHWPHSRELLDRQMGGVPADQRRKMEADNILEFLGTARP